MRISFSTKALTYNNRCNTYANFPLNIALLFGGHVVVGHEGSTRARGVRAISCRGTSHQTPLMGLIERLNCSSQHRNSATQELVGICCSSTHSSLTKSSKEATRLELKVQINKIFKGNFANLSKVTSARHICITERSSYSNVNLILLCPVYNSECLIRERQSRQGWRK